MEYLKIFGSKRYLNRHLDRPHDFGRIYINEGRVVIDIDNIKIKNQLEKIIVEEGGRAKIFNINPSLNAAREINIEPQEPGDAYFLQALYNAAFWTNTIFEGYRLLPQWENKTSPK